MRQLTINCFTTPIKIKKITTLQTPNVGGNLTLLFCTNPIVFDKIPKKVFQKDLLYN